MLDEVLPSRDCKGQVCNFRRLLLLQMMNGLNPLVYKHGELPYTNQTMSFIEVTLKQLLLLFVYTSYMRINVLKCIVHIVRDSDVQSFQVTSLLFYLWNPSDQTCFFGTVQLSFPSFFQKFSIDFQVKAMCHIFRFTKQTIWMINVKTFLISGLKFFHLNFLKKMLTVRLHKAYPFL